MEGMSTGEVCGRIVFLWMAHLSFTTMQYYHLVAWMCLLLRKEQFPGCRFMMGRTMMCVGYTACSSIARGMVVE